MENKILMYRENKKINDTLNAYNAAKARLQRIVDYLKKINVEASLVLIKNIVDNGNMLEGILAKKAENESQSIPALETMIKNKSKEDFDAIMELGKAAYSSIYDVKVSPLYNPDAVYFEQFTLKEGMITISPENLKAIEDSLCIYIDTTGRELIYNKAQKVIDAVKDLQESLNTVQFKKISEYTNIYAITPLQTSGISILAVDHDGDIVINGENFDFIV